jgi:hypothetical protein
VLYTGHRPKLPRSSFRTGQRDRPGIIRQVQQSGACIAAMQIIMWVYEGRYNNTNKSPVTEHTIRMCKWFIPQRKNHGSLLR